MVKLRVAFYIGQERIFNRSVCWWLSGPFSHTELILDEDDGLCRCASSSFQDDGVRVKWMSLNPDHWVFLDIDADYVFADKWFRDHRGEDYDVLGLLGFVWRRGTGDRTKHVCSAAIAAALGFPDPWRFDPMTLHAALVARNDAVGAVSMTSFRAA